jgi:hypothetical protein
MRINFNVTLWGNMRRHSYVCDDIRNDEAVRMSESLHPV